MGFESTLILYGLLSDKPAGGINTIGFIGKSQTIESFLLSNWLVKKTQMQYLELVLKAEALYKTVLKTQMNGNSTKLSASVSKSKLEEKKTLVF